ncbi:MAG: NDP-sugar synthase [Desulfomonile tiedjei]|nr:NDP-sugar synthase [Desulfomonile tiedjei]
MKGMILSAGLGTRLRPLTFERAKPAIPILGKPLVVRLIEHLIANGIREFRLNLHHLPQTIEEVFRTPGTEHLGVSFSYEPEILGTAGGLKANEAFFDEDTLLMANADILIDFPIRDAIAFHRKRRPLATLLLYPQNPPYRYFPVRIDEDGRLSSFKGVGGGGALRPEVYVFTGIHLIEPEIFSFIPSGKPWEINDQTYPEAIGNGKEICGFPVHGYWNDLGDPGRYLTAQRDLLVAAGTQPPAVVSPTAQIAGSCRLGPFVSVSAGCVLEEGTSAENSILWDGARLARGASVRNCIIGSHVTIDRALTDMVITRNGVARIG